MPGLRKFSNITLKRGVIKSDNDFFKWLSTIKLNTVARRDLVISLLNPKAILFLLSFFVQFIDPTYDRPAIPFLTLSAIVITFSALYFSALIFAGARLAKIFRARKRLTSSLSNPVGVYVLWLRDKLHLETRIEP